MTAQGRMVEQINRSLQRRGARVPRIVRRSRMYLVRENQQSRKVRKARARIQRAIAHGGGGAL